MFNKKKNGKKAFTLVELLVVIAILAILATVSTVGYLGFIENARRSKDIQLVSNINHVLAAEQAYTDSPVAAVEIVENLEEKGFELKTESKNAYLFYNTNTNRVELGDFDENGYKKVYPEDDSKSSTYGVETFGTIDDLIYAPESFIDGYLLIGKSSRDGFADAINTIRNPKSYSDIAKALETINGFKKATNANTSGNSVYSVLNTLVGDSAFITSNTGESEVIDGDDRVTLKRYAIFSQNVDTLTNSTIEKISRRNVRIIDVPSNVKNVQNDPTTHNNLLTLSQNSTIVASQEFINMLIAMNWKDVAVNIVLSSERNDAVKGVTFIKQYPGSGLTDSVTLPFTKGIVDISAYQMMAPSTDSSKAYKFDNWSYKADGSHKVEVEEVYDSTGNPTNLYRHTVDAGDEFLEQDADGNIVIYVNFNVTTPTALINDKYFTIEDAIQYASGNNAEDTIRYISTNGEINKDLLLESKDSLYLPRNASDSTNYLDRKEKNGLISNDTMEGYPVTKIELYSTLAVNKKFVVNGKIFIGGQQYCSGSWDTGNLVGEFARMDLKESGKLILNSGSSVYAYGELIGSSSDTQIIVNSGANIHIFMYTDGWRGGTVSSQISDKLFPMSTYNFGGLYAKTSFAHNSLLNAHFSVRVTNILGCSGSKYDLYEASALVIGNEEKESLFKIHNGTFSYYNDRSTINIIQNGNATMSSISLDLNGYFDFDTEKIQIPFTSRMDLRIKSGSVLNVVSKSGVKLLPGSKITIDEGATMNIGSENGGSSLYVYEWSTSQDKPIDNQVDYYGFNKYFERFDDNSNKFVCSKDKFINNAQLIVNGNLNFYGESNFSGHITGTGKVNNYGSINFNNKLVEIVATSKDDLKWFNIFPTSDGKSSFNGVLFN